MPRIRTYGLDIDTIRFAQRIKSGSGTTILPEPLKQINKFVVGIKKLGLWNSMVCWPMRSIHNAGTGSTVYSLGGLGIYNGTMVNSPTWSTDGVTSLVASAQGISATINNLTLNEQTLFGVGRAAVASQGYVLVARNSTGGTQNGMSLRAHEFGLIVTTVQQVNGSTTIQRFGTNTTNFFGYAAAANTTTGRVKEFPSVETSDTNLSFTGNLTNTDPLWIGRRNAAAGTQNNTIAFASVFIKDLRNNWDLLYSLYKRTLGIGLNLP